MAERLGARIRAARKNGGLTQKELAEKLGIRLAKMESLESGEIDPAPHLPALEEHTGEPLTAPAGHGYAVGGPGPADRETGVAARRAQIVKRLTKRLTR